ncbi:transposase [Streptomyces sp. NPDC005263]|uniref:transposase n=1 Tax=Streptomyces sp. NPDC005263 TaxID=3364711 RepID=UPI0036C56B7A
MSHAWFELPIPGVQCISHKSQVSKQLPRPNFGRKPVRTRGGELLAPLIPRAVTGRRRVSDRQVLNGMVYKMRTGISWRDLPERYGPWKTVYRPTAGITTPHHLRQQPEEISRDAKVGLAVPG